MDIIILGKNSDDRGTQLEILTQQLLKNLGFTNITRSEIGSGGYEIDVTAEYDMPGIKSSFKQIAICECKALKAPIVTSDWMKFLGKIFTLEANGNRIYGCFIALNGVNGNVKGQYRALQEYRKDIQLISGDDLIEILNQLYKPLNENEIHDVIGNLTDRRIQNISLCYYDNQLYWLIIFTGNTFSILDKQGCFIDPDLLSPLNKIIADTQDFGIFIPLEEEKANKERALVVGKYIISMFLLYGKRYSISELLNACQQAHGRYPPTEFTQLEVESSLTVLMNEGIVIKKRQFFSLVILQKGYTQQDVFTTFRWLLDELIIKIPLGSKRYQSFINVEFLENFAEMQGRLQIPDKEKTEWLKILKLSPSSLRWALNPDPFLLEHRLKFPPSPEIDASDIAYISQSLALMLSKDFGSDGLRDYFNEIDIIELETSQNIKLKSSKKVVSSLDFNERLRLGIFGEHKQVIVIRVLPNVPETWEN